MYKLVIGYFVWLCIEVYSFVVRIREEEFSVFGEGRAWEGVLGRAT